MTRCVSLLAGIAALLATPAAGQVTDFRLQPGPTPTPTVIGPPPETPAPRPSPTPTPAPTSPAPAPTPTPRVTPPTALLPTPRSAAARPTPRPNVAAPAAPAPSAPPVVLPSAGPVPTATPPPAAPSPVFPSAAIAPPEKSARWWPWIVAAFLLGGAALAGLLRLRRRIGPLGPLVVPDIESPRVPLAPEPEPEAAPVLAVPEPEPIPAEAEAHPLHIAIELRKLTLTLMNATLGYRLTLTNAGAEPLADIAVAADLIGAHSSLPRETQLAGPEAELPVHQRLAGLAPGESGDVSGELRVPLSELRPIAQGRARLFVPLARFRVGAEGGEPRYFTLVAGQPSPSGNGAIQPVRLDLGPRIYDGLAGRAF